MSALEVGIGLLFRPLPPELHRLCGVIAGPLGEIPMSMHTHTHFEEEERISSAMTELLALGLVAALAFWLVQVPL
jgi:hypothetical protein